LIDFSTSKLFASRPSHITPAQVRGFDDERSFRA